MRRASLIILAFLLVVAAVALGVSAYHAGEVSGLAQSGKLPAPAPGYYPYAYGWHPYWFFPFGFLFFPLFVVVFVLLLRGIFWRAHGARHGWCGPGTAGYYGHWGHTLSRSAGRFPARGTRRAS